MSNSGLTLALLGELTKATANNTAATLAMMSQMDIDALKVLATAYKVNSSLYNWLWVYRVGTVTSTGIGLAGLGGQTPELFIGGTLSAVVFLILWCNLSDKISNSEF